MRACVRACVRALLALCTEFHQATLAVVADADTILAHQCQQLHVYGCYDHVILSTHCTSLPILLIAHALRG